MEIQIYEPGEDSFLLADEVKKHAKGKVLEIGCGSGILSDTAASLKKVKSVIAVDINPHVIKYMKHKDKSRLKFRKKITVVKSDLFSNVKEKFDTIIFNPPYLPEDEREPDDWLKKAITGGKKGWEIIERFLERLPDHLNKDGIVLLLFSSLTNKKKVDDLISGRVFDYKQLAMKKLDFEQLFVYSLKKSKLLHELEKKKLTNIKKIATGWRGIVYEAKQGKKKIAIKVQKEAGGPNRIKNEVDTLKILNKNKIGPKFLFSDSNFFAMEFVHGQMILDYVRTHDKPQIKKVLKEVLRQCYVMDKLMINKEEMHHPIKHIIINDRTKLIDFERCRKTISPKNVTQFAQFLSSTNFLIILRNKGFAINPDKMRRQARVYKGNMNEKTLEKLYKEIK
ncbi:methyltransferase [Candidatus Woesearchaeota archaeon]|nr:methyltransferase [Candidatus Woesearchaeota archaeon]MBW3017691.1 methyltransferase [Candidatus Woesearchaeota archaeon]